MGLGLIFFSFATSLLCGGRRIAKGNHHDTQHDNTGADMKKVHDHF